MDYAFLIGVPESVATGLADRSVSIRERPTIPTDLPGVNELKAACLVVIGETQWGDWSVTTLGVRALPPVFVLVNGRTLDVERQESFLQLGAIGCSPLSDLEWVLDGILASIKRRDVSRETPAFPVGSLTRIANTDTETPLIAWSTGAWAGVFETLRSIELGLQPLWPVAASDVHQHPFDGAHAVDWLEAYAFHKFGAVFSDREAGDKLVKKVVAKTKAGLGLVEAFETTFMKQTATRAPTVLVLGETGTGKTLVAKRLHRALERSTGPRVSLPFHHVNCSTLGDMADVELFGAIRGAYTSLDVTNPGAIFASFGGTVFLDEFGALNERTQAKLLLFLEDGSVRPMAWVGGPMRIPVLIVAATNERLVDRVSRGQFRADLYYRFRDGRVTLPSLRETKARDLPYLVDYFLQSDRSGRPKELEAAGAIPVSEVGVGALDELMTHDYPGNVRELQAVLARAIQSAVRRRSAQIAREDIEFEESTLPRQDAVVAIITRNGDQGLEVLLRWNPYWRNWFLPSGRVEAETYEACLERELKEKLGLLPGIDPGTYGAAPVADQPEISLIQYSSRDAMLKQYHFHAYFVTVNGEIHFDGREAQRGVRWFSVSLLRDESQKDAQLSATLSRFIKIWIPSAATEQTSAAQVRSSSPPGS